MYYLDSDNDFESANTSLAFSPPKEQTFNLNGSSFNSKSTARPDIQIIQEEEGRAEVEPDRIFSKTSTVSITEEKQLQVNNAGESKPDEEIISPNVSSVTKPNISKNNENEDVIEQDSSHLHGDRPSNMSVGSIDCSKADLISMKLTFESPTIKKDEVLIYLQGTIVYLYLKE